MISRRLVVSLPAVLLQLLPAPDAAAASTFVRVPLGKGASIEIPKDWEVLSGSARTTIEAYVESVGQRLVEASLGLGANLFDDSGKSIALVSAIFYPENTITQTMARALSAADVAALDEKSRVTTEASLKSRGLSAIKWIPARMQAINGLSVFVHEHLHTNLDDRGLTRNRRLRVWASPRSFTVSLAYREPHGEQLRPIIDHIAGSIRLE